MRHPAALVADPLALSFTAACRERGRPDPNIRMAVSHERTEEPAATTGAGRQAEGAMPTRLEVPPEVEKAYSGIRLRWKD